MNRVQREATTTEPSRWRRGKWLVYAQHDCLHLIGPCYSGDHIVAAMNHSTCPKCGAACDLNYRDTWARVIRRWIRDGKWYLPWTWRRGHWEYRVRGHLEEGGYDYRKHMRNAATRRPRPSSRSGVGSKSAVS